MGTETVPSRLTSGLPSRPGMGVRRAHQAGLQGKLRPLALQAGNWMCSVVFTFPPPHALCPCVWSLNFEKQLDPKARLQVRSSRTLELHLILSC